MPALAPGTRLGPYEILDAIGAGGMGEVYRGRDTRLDRVVAIKVLAANLAADVPSRERFEREAKAISSLNHPNICALYDVGRERPSADESPVDFLVMEFVEGETLAARLARGPSRATRNAALSRGDAPAEPSATPLPTPAGVLPSMTVEEALAVAIQVAAALDRAHRQGIVHRDLKPGNVMLSKGHIVKLLDFGLARLTRPGGGADANEGLGRGLVSLADLSMPTVSSPLTMKGTILGTLQYMSPEQLEGKEVDARTDIFAFGGVLYEMLTGRRPFEGKSQASLIGAILDHQPPPVTSFQPVSPPMLDEIVARCLAKEPDDRWQSARDLKRQLEWVASHLADSATTVAAAVPAPRARAAGRALSIGAALLAGAVIAGGLVAWLLRPAPVAPGVVARFSIDLPEDQRFTRFARHVIALSPDGTDLVYVANGRLYLRKMGELTAVPIAGTEKSNPAEPIFSPDGQWVAFWSELELKKVPIGGGTPVTLARGVSVPLGGSWTGDRILLGQDSPLGIFEVPASGGAAKLLVGVDESKAELAYSPQLIAGGRAVLFTLRTGQQPWDESLVVVHELATGRRTTLVNGGTDARVLPTGHLAYVRDASLFAMPFDEQRIMVTGGAVPIQAGGIQVTTTGAAQITVSASGAMAAVGSLAETRELVWLTRQGQRVPAASVARAFRAWYPGLVLSPDGTRAATIIDSDARSDIWVATFASDTLTRLTFAGALSPAWTPDGSRICFVSSEEVFCQSADGSGKPMSLFKSPGMRNSLQFSADGSRLVFTSGDTEGNDIMMATLGPPIEVRPLINTAFRDTWPAISPDGRWIAYTSDESGRQEVYVRPFPDVGRGRWQVSTDGGKMPRWTKHGRELIFRRGPDLAGEFWVSAIQPGASFGAGRPTQIAGLANASNDYDIAADGRLLATMPARGSDVEASRLRIVVVQNWFDELKARVPAAGRRD